MGTASRLRTDDVDGGGTPAPLVAGQSRAHDVTRANMGTADVRYQKARTTVITLKGYAAGDEFKLGAYALGADGDFVRSDTIAFTNGTDCAASDLQTALRTATGDTSLTVTGTTDTGPFTVTYVALDGQPELVAHTITGGAAVQISTGALSYDEGAEQSGTPASYLPSDNGVPFDVESSKGVKADVPLGYSVDSRGTAVTRGTELLPPTVDGATSGDSGATTITATEHASGGTGAVVLYAIRKLDLAASPTQYVTVDSEDADGDVTISSLAAGNYVLLAHTQTADGQVSRPAAPVYFTVA